MYDTKNGQRWCVQGTGRTDAEEASLFVFNLSLLAT